MRAANGGRRIVKDRGNMNPAWLVAIIALPVVAAGVICGIAYDDARMFYAGLIGAVLMLAVLPLAVFFVTLIFRTPYLVFISIDFLRRLFFRKR